MRDEVARLAAAKAIELAKSVERQVASKGERGEKGDQGDKGDQGLPGRNGIDGRDGVAGPKGDMGEQGPIGPQGPVGPQGVKGDKGDKGDAGPAGSDGLPGVMGERGFTGPMGPMPKHEKKGLMIRFESEPGVWGKWITMPTGGGGGGRDDKLTDRQAELVALAEFYKTRTSNTNKFIKSNGTDIVWDVLDGSDIDLASPPAIGSTTPNTGAFTTLSASSTVSGTGFSTYLASPPAIGGTTPAAGTFTTLTATGQSDLGGTSSTKAFRVSDNSISANPDYLQITSTSFNRVNALASGGTNSQLWLGALGSGYIAFTTSGTSLTNQMRVTHTASAVNYVQVTGAATGNSPAITAQGSDSYIDMDIRGKGTGGTLFRNAAGANQFYVGSTASAVNYLKAIGSVTGLGLQFSAQGTDTNISQVFQSKGTGAIDLAAGSSGVNISNGGTVTAITRTATGSGYTSFPTVAISAPTTAGGVQATASVAQMLANNPTTVQAGGTGYTVGDVLTVVGGTPVSGGATFTVSSVSGGVVTAVTATNFANYTALPTNPVTTTGGTGTGCTLNVTYSVQVSFTITNAGSGYVEQPTVTFSGGGGSGAAAYATVGSTPIIRGLGQTLSFYTPGGEAFRVVDLGVPTANFVRVSGSASGSAPSLYSVGGDTNVDFLFQTKGTGNFRFLTNQSPEQFRVAHTASSVNYVQVTGAATGGSPVISAQGSDTNANIWLTAKGTGFVGVYTAGTQPQLLVTHTASVANWMQITGAATGVAPKLSVAGSDTNIDLALTPKGTGNVRFGTYTANMALTVQGYIEIKDSGGTVRKLAVIA